MEESCAKRYAEWEAELDGESKKELEKKKRKLEAAKVKLQNGINFLNEHADRKRIHLTDPDADWHKHGAGFIVGYSAQTAVDAQSGMVVHTEVVTGQSDSTYTVAMVNAMEAVKGEVLPAKSDETKYVLDCGYASEANLKFLTGRDLYLPDRDFARLGLGGKLKPEERPRVTDTAPETGAMLGSESVIKFQYNADLDSFSCPNNKVLDFKREKSLQGVLYRKYKTHGCGLCPLRRLCAGNGKNAKEIWVQSAQLAVLETKEVAAKEDDKKAPVSSVKAPQGTQQNTHTAAMRDKLNTPEGKATYAKRFPAIEGNFGVIKNARQGWRFLRRTVKKVNVDWAERCFAHNLAKLIKFRQVAWG